MSTMYIYRGLPGSGKSTRAQIIQSHEGGVIAGRDHLRMVLFNRYTCSRDEETYITEVQNMIIINALQRRENVHVDDMNLRAKYMQRLYSLVKEVPGSNYEVLDFSDVPLKVCLEQNKQRRIEKVVPDDVIIDLHKRFIGKKGKLDPVDPQFTGAKLFADYVPATSLPRAIGVDLDGTLALKGDRDIYDGSKAHLDTPNAPVLDVVWAMWREGYEIFFCSGRSDEHRNVTVKWICDHVSLDKQYVDSRLFMRKANDQRRDSVVKLELFDEHIRNRWNVRFMLDDRNQVVDAWRSIGLTVFQVAEGDF